MALLLDPAVPLVWRSPHAMQLGFDRNVVVFDQLSAIDETLIEALRRGVTAEGLRFIARAAGGDNDDVNRMLGRLRAHLAPTHGAPPAARPRVLVDGTGTGSEHIGRILSDAGVTLVHSLPPEAFERVEGAHDTEDRPDLVLIIDRFVLPPARYRAWLSLDVPHLPVLFGESAVTVGPLVRPGRGPCLYCIEMHRTEVDATWPTVASQLVGLAARAETATVALAAAARIAAWLTAPAPRLGTQLNAQFDAQSLRIDASSGRISRELHRPHAECACQALPESAMALAANAEMSPAQTS